VSLWRFFPARVQLNTLDEVIGVHDGDSIILAQMLASKLGLAVGISSGANFLGAVKVQNKLGGKAIVVTTFSDSNKKYLSTDLVKNEAFRDGYLSKNMELKSFNIIRRVCEACLDHSL
jgi:cysteine synthase A